MTRPALQTPFAMTIGGEAVGADRVLEVVNPSTAEVFAHAPDCAAGQVDDAVAAAAQAFAAWAATPLEVRRARLREFGERIRASADDLAALLTREQGKPLEKSRSEIAAGLAYLESFTKIDLAPAVLRDTPAQRAELVRRPLGVVGAITAWNYPILLALWKIGPAVVTGNTVVVKPSPYTPLTTLRLGELARGVFPAGVVNVIAGGNEVGARLTEHPQVRKITFTGSAATGRRVMAAASGTLKRLTLELGGNDAGIVLDDVDARKIAGDLFWAKFSNCGQVCAALKRLYVHESVYGEVCAALAEMAAAVKVADGFEPDAEIGPIQNRMQYDRVSTMLDEALAAGARVLFRGEAPKRANFFPVTLLTEARPGMRVVDEEVFGPVLPILSFRDEEAVLAAANATEYGLGGSVWSADAQRAAALAARLESGSAWVNQHPAMGPDIPFGGVKGSGIGIECARWGMEEYTSIQVVNVKKN
jgi:acyl-CoA reductase-like NAD-dependent aldehyde dehydrogenase